jgi:AcrR family transcriptional regulator
MVATLSSPPSRREANRLSRREAILDVAKGSFLNQGYAGTTMSAIAAELGGSKGTLWSYFPSKEALFEAVIERATEEFRHQLTVVLNPADDIEVALSRFCRHYLTRVMSADGVALHRLVVAETGRFPEVGKIFYTRGPRQTHLLLAGFIADAQQHGRLQGIDPLQAAQQLTWLCMAGHYQMLLTGAADTVSAQDIAIDVEAAMATFLRAYGERRQAMASLN